MVEVVDYRDEHRDAWRFYVGKSPDSMLSHLVEWREIIEKGLGHSTAYSLALRDSEVAGVFPLALVKTWWGKKYLVSLPWIDYCGILADDDEIKRALMNHAIERARAIGAEFVELRTETPDGLDLAHRTDKVTFLLELNEDPEVLWKDVFNGKLRNQIRKSDKSGLTTDYGGLESLDDFYAVFSYNMRDLGTPVWSKEHFRQVLTLLPDNSKFILVRMNEKTIAAGLLLWYRGRYYVPSASSYREYIKHCPNHALYWRVIEDACRKGGEFFDFGRSTKDSNTFRFKKQWAPEPTQLTWQYYLNKADEVPMLNPSNPKYSRMISLWRKLPLKVANFLGPKVMRNFP